MKVSGGIKIKPSDEEQVNYVDSGGNYYKILDGHVFIVMS